MKLPATIQAALTRFQSYQGSKKGILFYHGQGFHFYNREVCSLAFARLSLHWRQLQIEHQLGQGQIEPLLLLVLKNQLQVVTAQGLWNYEKTATEKEEFHLSLSYGVLYDPARESYLRGFIYLHDDVSAALYESYFVEPSIGALLELFMFPPAGENAAASCVKNQVIGDLVRQMNQKNIEALAKMYLKGAQADALPLEEVLEEKKKKGDF